MTNIPSMRDVLNYLTESPVEWATLKDMGFSVSRHEDKWSDVWKITKGNEVYVVNLAMGEVWFQYDYEHSRDATQIGSFEFFDADKITKIILNNSFLK
jgi:hypothetical protein